MIDYKILVWGAKSKSLILFNMIKNNELFYKNKKIKNKKINLLVDPFLKKPEFISDVTFVNKKNHFIKNLKKANSFIVAIGENFGKARYLISEELIKKKLDEIKSDKKDLFESLSFELSEILNDNHINAEIHGREKTPFSIWRKVQKKRISLEQITDIIGFRITLSSVDECYKTLGIFHKKWNCIPGKFKDYISSPKINGYKSLHTSVIGSNKKPIEIQIRTHEMHEFAERGVASHWKYKSSEKFNSLSWKEYDWLKDLVEIIEKNENPEHSYEYTKLQMFQENVFCFTPKGSVIKLPKDATPIDFAYAVHTKIGNTAIGCEINGNKSELQEILRNGDRVNIITSKNQSPSLHWIPTTKTGKARAAIRRYWHDKGEQKEEKIKKYNTTLWISLPDQPGQLGDISSLIGSHKLNI